MKLLNSVLNWVSGLIWDESDFISLEDWNDTEEL